MKICSRHFDALAAALKRKGLWYLCSTQHNQVAHDAAMWLQGRTTDATWNPVVVCLLEIYSKADQVLGDYCVSHPDSCPLCQMPKVFTSHKNLDDAWIDNITDMMVLVAITNGIDRRTTV